MKILAAAWVLVISLVVIALQLTGWSQSEPRTVNLASSIRSADGPPVDSATAAGPIVSSTPPAFPRTQPTGSTRLLAEVRQTSQFIWPAQGPLSSYFGAYHVLGIDIALDNSEDSPILAAAQGVVEFAGGSACCEYGLYVVLSHDGNRSTLYGHLSQILVSQGEDVVQGQLLGYGGSTGVSDGKHLHFEIHDGEKLVDPLRFLPAAERSTQPPTLRTDCTSDFLRVDPESRLTMEFIDSGGFRPVSARFDDDAIAAGWDAHVEGFGGLSHRVTLSIPAAPSARGLIRDANVTIMLSDDPEMRTVECAMRLATMVTMANAPRITRHTSAPLGTPTATPIRSKYPTPTPPVKTPTPGAAKPTAQQSAPVTGSTPRPVATVPPSTPPKTAPTVKPPQQFPIRR